MPRKVSDFRGLTQPARLRLLRAVQRQPGRRVRELAAELEMPLNTARDHLWVLEDEGLIRREQVATPVTTDPEEVWAAVEALLVTTSAGQHVSGVGIGCGGPMLWPDGEVSPLNIPAWRGFPLLARVRSQLRRYMTLGGGHVAPTAVTIGGVSLDDNAKTVTVDGDTVNLTPLEYDILRLLMQHPGKVFSPHEIYRRVWHEDPAADNPVAVHVRHIREKIEINPAEPRYLKVVWGKGYKMEGAAQ